MKKLNSELMKKIAAVISGLEASVEAAEVYSGEKSEKWQEEKGDDYCAWIELLQAALDALTDVTESPEC